MPVEAAAEPQENRGGAVRRSGRQSKRTDKLEEFLSTAKRAARRSGPSSIESGDPPSQTPTDAETASEASFDGNADAKAAEDRSPSPERRTRSGARKQSPGRARGGRLTRSGRGEGGGGTAAKDDGSSENEEDSGDDATSKAPLQDNSLEETQEDEAREACPQDEVKESGDLSQADPEPDSEKQDQAVKQQQQQEEEEKPEEHEGEKVKEQPKIESEKDSEEEGQEKPPGGFAKRGPIRTYTNKKKVSNKSPTVSPAVSKPALVPTMKGAFTARREPNRTNVAQPSGQNRRSPEGPDDDDDDEDESMTTSTSSSSSSDSEEAGYDPNALYCICRQKHNKRFMICCDRCEEWFHGDCVGITEARGRLMERNGEDYICPNCTARKSQVLRPATGALAAGLGGLGALAAGLGALAAGLDAGKAAREARRAEAGAALDPAASSPLLSGAGEEKLGDEPGIKGRIEKATHPSGKKKIKIFQPVGSGDKDSKSGNL
ncbi:hypothetical protein NHX12_030533 [Muraenolepis orangiensis]|uniref:PHD-type domain-containing protein n=1 Tax=Muraenolepis orangiensis TaxID=630683 RepID=A0A9Q0ILR4_9TELE|nr:hypothetical protein NHX12_030533 [Muraenolepis orangiensis]